MTVEQRTQALLELVERDRSTQCAAILEEARARAATLVAAARVESRARMREAFAEQRRRAHDCVAAARAKLGTRRRLHDQQRAAVLLDLGWQRLPDALRARWRDEAMRHAWIDAVVAAALRALPRVSWRIVHDPGWPPDEQQAVGNRLASPLDAAPSFVTDARIVAGLRIAAGGNVIDGTLEGLLADRAEVGAKLMRQLEYSP
jgi:hypothetical protein